MLLRETIRRYLISYRYHARPIYRKYPRPDFAESNRRPPQYPFPNFNPMSHKLHTLLFLIPLGLSPAAPAKKTSDTPAATANFDWSTPEARSLQTAWKQAQFRFTPAVKNAYLAAVATAANHELTTSGQELPADFLAWVAGDPVVAATVCGARSPARALVALRSLELDLGAEEVRHKHTQLALAMAVVYAANGAADKADRSTSSTTSDLGVSLAPRNLLALSIPPCPLKPVNTHPTDRPLDVNDHIINFFDGRTVEADKRIESTDAKGKKVVTTEKRPRPMAACDVMASAKLQDEFNAYMKSKGQKVEVHCGDHIIYPESHDAVKGPDAKPILEAYHLFKAAYEAKGLLPAQRDAQPTLAETCAWLIRNDTHPLPAGVKRKWDHWPLFPLNSPWPVLTFLAQSRQPLRECEDIFARYRDKGEFHGYGEYIGAIAQQFDFQSARRLAPYDFSYGTFQMMLKDGGVCGTMANLCARSNQALGIPSCTAGQPGHCALVSFSHDDKKDIYQLVGGQFVTGGPDKTTPHLTWIFGDDSGRRGMVYPMATAWAINHGFQPFLDSILAWELFRKLPQSEQKSHGMPLLESGLALNPYNFMLVESAQSLAATPQEQLTFWHGFSSLLAAETKDGCPKDGIFPETVREKMFHQIAAEPLPSNKAEIASIAAMMETEKCADAEAWLKYQSALHGFVAVRTQVADVLKAAVTGSRTPQSCDLLAGRIGAVAKEIKTPKDKASWAQGLLETIIGHEEYLPAGAKKNAKKKQDPCAALIFKLAGKDAEAKAREAALKKETSTEAGRDLSK